MTATYDPHPTPANACTACQRELGEDDGAWCVWCVEALVLERGAEWWAA